MVSKWSQHPWKIGPGTQQKTMLKNRAPKIKKYSKNDFKIKPKEWLYFGGFASCGAFGGSNRFCDQKVGPQRSQSALKDRKMSQKWHQRVLRVRKWAPKVDPFRGQAKMSSNTGPFWDPGPADCAKRLQSYFTTQDVPKHFLDFLKHFWYNEMNKYRLLRVQKSRNHENVKFWCLK